MKESIKGFGNDNIRAQLMKDIDDIFENVVDQDKKYIELEQQKQTILHKLYKKLDGEELKLVLDLVDCLDGQNYLVAISFFFARILGLIAEDKKSETEF